MPSKQWEPITSPRLAAFAGGLGLFLIVLFLSPPGFIMILDFANLLFHEAGHPIFGLVNERLGVYGGTLGQLTFPLFLMISFWRKSQPIPFAVAWIWFFENWLNIARYMADARALQLPLVGGGDHDWNEIFTRWNALSNDTHIAQITKILGWLGMTAAVLWLFRRAWNDRKVSNSGIRRTHTLPNG